MTMMILFDNDDREDCEDGDHGGDDRKVQMQNQGNIETMRPKGTVRFHHEDDLDLCDGDLGFDLHLYDDDYSPLVDKNHPSQFSTKISPKFFSHSGGCILHSLRRLPFSE